MKGRMGLAVIAAALFALAVSTQSAHAAPFSISCPGALNVDSNPETVVSCNVGQTGTITDLNVELVISSGFISDLDYIQLSKGSTVTLYAGSQDLFGFGTMDAIFDDAAGSPPPATGDVIGTFQPTGPGSLEDFDGVELSGLWTLHILDTLFPDEGDNLVTWRLFGTTETTETTVPEPATLLLLSTGLAALGGMAWRRSRL